MIFSVWMPDYYPSFSCTGSDCAYHCCQNWRIDFSRADYNKIRSAKKSKQLEAVLKQGMKRHKDGTDNRYAFFVTTQAQCAMQRDDGLCRLQAECGAAVLPSVCRIFPRNTVQGDGCLYCSCSAGCPEVLKNLALRGRPLTFVQKEEMRDATFQKNHVLDSKVHPFAQHYNDVMAICVGILQNRNAPMAERMVLLGIALRALDELEQHALRGEPQEPQFAAWRAKYATLAQAEAGSLGMTNVDPSKAVLSNMLLTHRMRGVDFDAGDAQMLQHIFAGLGQCTADADVAASDTNADKQETKLTFDYPIYAQARKELNEVCEIDPMLENIMVNYLFSKGCAQADDATWQDYLYICQVYSYLCFTAVSCYAHHKNIDKMLIDLAICYRCIAHSTPMKRAVVEHMEQNDCTTLAHMAMLVRV